MVTKEQEEEFKRRKAEGPKLSSEEVELFNSTGVKLTEDGYLEFLKATDEKCE